MSKEEKKFVDSLKNLTAGKPSLRIATVDKVNDSGTVDVTLDDNDLNLNCKVKADIAIGVGIEVIPSIGSKVLIIMQK